jgi:hypothetical protein
VSIPFLIIVLKNGVDEDEVADEFWMGKNEVFSVDDRVG